MYIVLFGRVVFIINPKRNTTLGISDVEEAGPFTDIDDDQDELEEN